MFLDTSGTVVGRVKNLVEPDAMLDVVRPAANKLHGNQHAQTP